MRILVLTHNLIERGNYFRAMKFAQFLANKGHSVTFVSSSYRWYKPNKYYIDRLRVIESPSWSFIIGIDDGWSPLGVLYRLWLVLKNKYDLVYGFSHKPVDFIPAFFSRFFRGSRYITDWCDWWGKGGLFVMIKHYRDSNMNLSPFRKMILTAYDKVEESLEEFVPKRADLVTVICKALYERAIAIGIGKDKILHLVSGADTVSIKPLDRQKAREMIKLSSYFDESIKRGDVIILGYTANYHLDEMLLLETLGRVCKEMKNVKLLVVGAEFRVRQKQMKQWGLHVFEVSSNRLMTKEDNIIHFGRRPFKEIKTFLAASDILLLPMTDIIYNKGRWPHKIGDYLASGRPIVVNDVGDIPELIKQYQAGYVAEPNAPDFADKIIQMINSPDKWELYGKNGRGVAETLLDWNKIGNRLSAKIEEIWKGEMKP